MTAQRGERFFLFMGLILFAIVLAGFLPAAISRPGGIASMPFLLHLHGAVFASWFVVFISQAALLQANNVRLHMRLGAASVGLATAMLLLSYFVIRDAYANPAFRIAGLSPAGSTIFPITDMVNFSIAYGLALRHRRNAVAHKRLMLLAGILIIDPAVARLITTLEAPVPAILLVELALFAALFTYDMLTRRRPHWTTVLGLGLYIAALVAKLTVAKQPWWAAFVNTLFA